MGANIMALIQTFQAIMTVPQRLSSSAQLRNCNVGPSWRVMTHIGACWHSAFSTFHSFKFFHLKIALGLALGKSSPLPAQPQKNTHVHKGMLLWESFPKQICKNYLRPKQGSKLMDQI